MKICSGAIKSASLCTFLLLSSLLQCRELLEGRYGGSFCFNLAFLFFASEAVESFDLAQTLDWDRLAGAQLLDRILLHEFLALKLFLVLR